MRYKSVLGAFLFICTASLVALMIFIHTKSFGNLLTRVVSDVAQRKAQTKVSIRSVEISLFPPGLELNRVTVSKKISDQEELFAEIGKFGFYISLIEIEEKRLTFGEIRISDSVIDYKFPKKDEPLNEIPKEVINKVFDLSEKSPIRIDTILLENSKVTANHDLLEVRRLKIFKKSKEFVARFHLSNIKPQADSELSLDEVWGDLEIGRKNIDVYRLKVQHDVQAIMLKGKIENYRLLKNASGAFRGEAHLHLKNIQNELNISDILQVQKGFISSHFNISYVNQKLDGAANFEVREIASNLIFADLIKGELKLKPESVTLESFSLVNNKESAELQKPAILYNLESKQLLPSALFLRANHLKLTNVLRFLPSLKVLKGELTGDVTLKVDNKDLFITPVDGFKINQLGLIVGSEAKPFTILMIKEAKLKETNLSVINGEFSLSSNITLPRSKFEVDGFVSKERTRFSVLDAQINLEDLGNISQIGIKGEGKLNVDVNGRLDDVMINLAGKMKGFEVLGYKLGTSDKEISIGLKDSEVIISKFESVYGSTPISGNGVVNYGNGDIALGINSPNSNYYDLTHILHPVLKDLTFLPDDLNLSAKIDANIYGKTSLPDLKIKSAVQFNDLTAYGENLNSGSFTIGLSDQVFSIRDLNAKKERGDIAGNFSLGIVSKKLSLDYTWDALAISSFNAAKKLRLNIDGKVSGSVKGSGTLNDHILDLKTKVYNTKSPSHSFEDSNISMKIMPNRIQGEAAILGNYVTSDFNLSLNRQQNSKLSLDIAIPDAKPLMTALLGQHLENEEINGKLYFNLDTSFNGPFKNMNLTAQVKTLALNHTDFKLNYSSTSPDFIIKDDRIQKWNLNIRESDAYIVTHGKGTFGESVALINEFHFNAKLLEILLAPVLSSEGFMRNVVRIDGKKDNYTMTISSKGSNLGLTIEGLPVPITALNYSVEYAGQRLQILELVSSLDAGKVSLEGDIYFDDNEPDVNVKYVLDRAEIPILGKSAINLSGEGIILGNEMPYNVSGEIIVNKAQIINELSDFSSKSNALSQVRFLPKNQESTFSKLLILNVNVKAENPVKIVNSLMDISLKGEVRLLGSPARLRGEGRLIAPVGTSRVFFKNNEYQIRSADITFVAKKDISNPDFDVQAQTMISNYKVYAKAYGDLERFSFDLTSDPALGRNSILSLIAFGYTDEMQNSLGQKNQQNLTQVGVGSFVFDRFKISDILNKQFGLQVNLGTVVEQSQFDSLLSGRSQEGQGMSGGVLGRTRSATKIELKKRLDEALTLSVSSTMGGNIGQRQSMNLTYGVNKKVQLEGVYELRTNDEGQEDIIDNSIGGDLKFRWTFK